MSELSEAIKENEKVRMKNLWRRHTTIFTKTCKLCRSIIQLDSIFFCSKKKVFIYKCVNCENLRFCNTDFKKKKLLMKIE